VVSGTTMRMYRLGSIRTARMRGRGRLGGSKCKCVWAHGHHVALRGDSINDKCGKVGWGGGGEMALLQLALLYSVVAGTYSQCD
jgi:hypothetical protein